jgi:[heparan sulfate]-glucosamine 3-sulfotransferase 5
MDVFILQAFPSKQIMVVDGDELVRDPFPEVRKVEDFLGLDHEITFDHFVFNATKGFYCIQSPVSQDDKCLNETKGRRHPKIPPAVIHTLRKFYAPYNRHFYSLVGKDFAWPEE